MSRTVVAITGASSGIGEVFARRLAGGHDLLLIARRRDRLELLALQLKAAHKCEVEIQEADLATDRGSAEVAAKLRDHDRLALLVNNAGFGARGFFWETPLETWEQMHRLHVMATVRLTHAALTSMVSRDDGGIINVASVASYVRQAGGVSYSATKTWMASFTEGLYLELRKAKSNVVVQALCPGYTHSEFHEKLDPNAPVDRNKIASPGWWLTAEEVVEASLSGLERRKLFVIPGWRYQALVSAISFLPASIRVALEAAGSRLGSKRLPSSPRKPELSN